MGEFTVDELIGMLRDGTLDSNEFRIRAADALDRMKAENEKLRALVESAFAEGWQERGSACYPTPMEFELPTAWSQSASKRRVAALAGSGK
jgi:alkanesulfonate monooxygenase SsuD/methylene tetrahydromethanopterin reductase-like flavin-dependent oxidoreductase (luciferase family)